MKPKTLFTLALLCLPGYLLRADDLSVSGVPAGGDKPLISAPGANELNTDKGKPEAGKPTDEMAQAASHLKSEGSAPAPLKAPGKSLGGGSPKSLLGESGLRPELGKEPASLLKPPRPLSATDQAKALNLKLIADQKLLKGALEANDPDKIKSAQLAVVKDKQAIAGASQPASK